VIHDRNWIWQSGTVVQTIYFGEMHGASAVSERWHAFSRAVILVLRLTQQFNPETGLDFVEAAVALPRIITSRELRSRMIACSGELMKSPETFQLCLQFILDKC
jgi:hypothetical protein